jgi:hypothetical protein
MNPGLRWLSTFQWSENEPSCSTGLCCRCHSTQHVMICCPGRLLAIKTVNDIKKYKDIFMRPIVMSFMMPIIRYCIVCMAIVSHWNAGWTCPREPRNQRIRTDSTHGVMFSDLNSTEWSNATWCQWIAWLSRVIWFELLDVSEWCHLIGIDCTDWTVLLETTHMGRDRWDRGTFHLCTKPIHFLADHVISGTVVMHSEGPHSSQCDAISGKSDARGQHIASTSRFLTISSNQFEKPIVFR